jgi:hypothetical protein
MSNSIGVQTETSSLFKTEEIQEFDKERRNSLMLEPILPLDLLKLRKLERTNSLAEFSSFASSSNPRMNHMTPSLKPRPRKKNDNFLGI